MNHVVLRQFKDVVLAKSTTPKLQKVFGIFPTVIYCKGNNCSNFFYNNTSFFIIIKLTELLPLTLHWCSTTINGVILPISNSEP